MSEAPWKIWVDTGGTFTDCIATTPEGKTQRLKILSSSVLRGKIVRQVKPRVLQVALSWPVAKDIFNGFTLRIDGRRSNYFIDRVEIVSGLVWLNKPTGKNCVGKLINITSQEEVPVLAARLLTETSLHSKFPLLEMKLGSTRGTNAILERKGARTAFVVTKGFKDLILIGTQQRPDLFALNIIKELPLYSSVIEVNERIEADGKIHTKLDTQEIGKVVDALKRLKAEAVAIALLNSYKNSIHEKMLLKEIREAGFQFVSASHQLSTQIKILPRAETTVVNAYLGPIISSYTRHIQQSLPAAALKIITSAGGIVRASTFHPKDSLLSGPAGGVVGAALKARQSGFTKIITFDMGGTSTDVSLYNERYDYRYESKVGNQKILSPALAIETIAAGGGSVCDFDGYRFTVGPQSAGASPGPACYGAGGPLTITDINLLLGRIVARGFAIPLNVKKAEEAMSQLILKVRAHTGRNLKQSEMLESFRQIANEKMAEAIRKVSIRNGHSPMDYALLSFGGAGGQHACALAEMLGMEKIIIPYDAGLLSASGIGQAETERFEEQLILEPLNLVEKNLEEIWNALASKAKDFLKAEGHEPDLCMVRQRLLFLRFEGQESSIEIETDHKTNHREAFRTKYESIFSHWLANREIEVESMKVRMVAEGQQEKVVSKKIKRYSPSNFGKQELLIGRAIKEAPVFQWEALDPGALISGPAIVMSDNSTTVIEEGWKLELDANNTALLTRKAKLKRNKSVHSEQAHLELYTNRFTAMAQEMGALLQRTSFSVNVKERLDFSCALLDHNGYLVVNAPHIPVHLGSMGVCVREVIKKIKIKEGDVIITNHPAYGGSHLPDVTLIKPVYFRALLMGYVTNRAHHAEIGGKTPGSMPADATTLEEEGVIIEPTYLIKNKKARWEEIKNIFTRAKYPTRAIEENLADLYGALAAVNLGEQALNNLCTVYGADEVRHYMLKLRTHASALLATKIKKLTKKEFNAKEFLDDGSVLAVRMRKLKGKLIIDFTGSSRVHSGNLNATKAIVQSAILYVLRLLVNEDIPMNEGLMNGVRIILPHGMLNPDFQSGKPLPAVVGGNTEVSQRLTDTLLKALGLAACSQGTMNNFLFGNERFGYYETICGGTGAGKGFDGSDAVHQHMTNTRITDPELMEFRYPVRLVRFEIRKNSGGKGKCKGGNGVVREIFFKEELDFNILSQHRVERPYGLARGKPGLCGEQIIVRKNGEVEKLRGMGSSKAYSGDRVIIKTPGGGGFGMQVK